MPKTQKRILIAPDNFKSSIDANTAAQAIARGINRANPDIACHLFPMADGGDGTAQTLTRQLHGQWIEREIPSPDSLPIMAGFGWRPDTQQAVIDVASCGGLADIGPGNLWQRNSYGVGVLLRVILERNPREIMIGLGGSASNDAGAGLLAALGYRFFDKHNQALNPTPAGLSDLHHIDSQHRDPRLLDTQLTILSDVENSLCGPQGATAVYGPQKGAKADDIAALDQRLGWIARILWQHHAAQQPAPEDEANAVSPPSSEQADYGRCSGAAGGLGFALQLLPNANVVPGAQTIAERLGLTAQLNTADGLITGEGCFDHSSLQGKVVGTLLRLAQPYSLPCIVLAGQRAEGVAVPEHTQVISLTQWYGSERKAQTQATLGLETCAHQLALAHWCL